jgi:hypothetical protein
LADRSVLFSVAAAEGTEEGSKLAPDIGDSHDLVAGDG